MIFSAVAVLFMVNSWNHFSADKYGFSLEMQVTGIKVSFLPARIEVLVANSLLWPVDLQRQHTISPRYIYHEAVLCRTLFRIVQTPRQAIVLYATLVAGAIVSVSTIIQGLLYCQPLNVLWEQLSRPGSHGHCYAAWTRVTAALVHAAWVLTADVILGLVLPCI
jgi:hypothetical protein